MESLPESGSADNTQHVDFAMDALVSALERVVRTRRGSGGSFQEFEQDALAICNEAVRRTLQQELQRESDQQTDEILVDGRLFRRHQPGSVTYHSLCGPLEVRRFTFREDGVRNGPTCVPLELAMGILHRATPSLAAAVARGHADRTSRALEEDLRAAQRVPPSRSTIERMGVDLGCDVKEAVRRIEPALRRRERIPGQARAITLGLDRTTVPMLERSTDGDKCTVQYRMAYVATVCITDIDANPLQTRRYAAPAHEGPHQLLSRVDADLRHALRQRRDLTVAVVQDGAPELWGLIWDLLKAAGVKKSIQRIDRYHANEHLSGALDALRVPEPIRGRILERWRDLLNRRDGAIDRINDELEEMRRGLPSQVQHEAYRHTMYLLCHAGRLRYATLRKKGIPQGSGVTEGACKSLVTVRTKRSGQRWSERGIESVLALRSVVHSDRWAPFWKAFTKRCRPSLGMIRG